MPKKYWAEEAFYNARAPILRDSLSPANQKKFDAMSPEKKKSVIAKLIKKGVMI